MAPSRWQRTHEVPESLGEGRAGGQGVRQARPTRLLSGWSSATLVTGT